MNWALLLAACTWPPCAIIVFIAVCRINSMPKHTLFRVVLEYSIWSAIGVMTPLLPLIGEWPGLGMVIGLHALVVVLLCSARAWAGDVAPDEATDRAPLRNELEPRT